MDNKSQKVSAVYDWIKNCKYIKLYNETTFVDDVKSLIDTTDFDFEMDLYFYYYY